MKVKTITLTGHPLSWAVAQAAAVEVLIWGNGGGDHAVVHPFTSRQYPTFYAPGVNWSHGGPIVECEWRPITTWLFGQLGPNWRDNIDSTSDDVLRWFMRAFVGSKLGNEVEIPDELL